METFDHLGGSGGGLVGHLTASAVGCVDEGHVVRKGVMKEGILQVIFVAMQIVVSWRVHRYRLALHAQREARVGTRARTLCRCALPSQEVLR